MPQLSSGEWRSVMVGIPLRMLDAVAARLCDAGVPLEAVGPIFDMLEHFAVGWAIRELSTMSDEPAAGIANLSNMILAASCARPLKDKLLQIAVIGIMDALVAGIPDALEGQVEPGSPCRHGELHRLLERPAGVGQQHAQPDHRGASTS
jgi:hypothetical protein